MKESMDAKKLEIVVTENDKMPYFEIKYKEKGTENYVNIYKGNDFFKGWIMAYYKLLNEKVDHMKTVY